MSRLISHHILIKESTLRWLRKHAKQSELSMSKIIRTLLEEYENTEKLAEKGSKYPEGT